MKAIRWAVVILAALLILLEVSTGLVPNGLMTVLLAVLFLVWLGGNN